MYICMVKNNYSPKYINMKKIFTFFAAMMLVGASFAQLPDYSEAKDFTLYEINKTTGAMITDQAINLYSMLNDYKTVFIDVSASTCGPCYNYHQTGALETLYETYGPGTAANDSRVLFIEGAPYSCSTWAQLTGGASGTWDCVHAYGTSNPVPYPVIPMGFEPNYSNGYASFMNNYNIGYFPTVYMICPSRHVFEVGQQTAANLHNSIASKCPSMTQADNAFLFVVSKPKGGYFCYYDFIPSFTLENSGTNNLTTAGYKITMGDGTEQSFTWTGNLAPLATEVVELPALIGSEHGTHSYTISLLSANGTNLTPTNNINKYSQSFVVQSAPTTGTLTNQTFTGSSWPTNWFSENGYCAVQSSAVVFPAYDISNGGVDYVYVPMLDFSNNPHPSLQFAYAYRKYSSSSNEKLQVVVSTDCGENWTTVWEKSGTSLTTVSGTTSSRFQPSSSQYAYDAVDLQQFAGAGQVIIAFKFTSNYGNNVWIDNVTVADHDLTNIENVELNSELSMYPNPATDVVNIAYDKAIDQVEIYDVNGKLVKSYGHVENTISVSGLATGNYMVKMYTEDGIITKTLVKE